jgi:hypothetical protein
MRALRAFVMSEQGKVARVRRLSNTVTQYPKITFLIVLLSVYIYSYGSRLRSWGMVAGSCRHEVFIARGTRSAHIPRYQKSIH